MSPGEQAGFAGPVFSARFQAVCHARRSVNGPGGVSAGAAEGRVFGAEQAAPPRAA